MGRKTGITRGRQCAKVFSHIILCFARAASKIQDLNSPEAVAYTSQTLIKAGTNNTVLRCALIVLYDASIFAGANSTVTSLCYNAGFLHNC
jgi:hypothetical protein